MTPQHARRLPDGRSFDFTVSRLCLQPTCVGSGVLTKE